MRPIQDDLLCQVEDPCTIYPNTKKDEMYHTVLMNLSIGLSTPPRLWLAHLHEDASVPYVTFIFAYDDRLVITDTDTCLEKVMVQFRLFTPTTSPDIIR